MVTNELDSEADEFETMAGEYPVNLRFTIPFFSIFVTLIMGREKRCQRRLREERVRHPLGTTGNVICAIIVGSVSIIAALYWTLFLIFPY